MLLPVKKKNVEKGLYYTMLLSASFHLLGSLYLSIRTGNPDYSNMFNLLGVSFFFPSLGHGALYNLLGIVMVIAIGVGVYTLHQYFDRKQRRHT